MDGRHERRIHWLRLLTLAMLALASAMLLISVATGVTQELDDGALLSIYGMRTPFWNRAFQAITFLGSYPAVILIGSVAALLLWKSRAARFAAAYLSLVAAGACLSEVMKLAVARPRPDLLMDLAGEGYSYPSAHTMAAVTCLLGLALFWPRGRGGKPARMAFASAAGALVGLVGFSRLYLGWHYPTDVLGSILMGASLILAYRLWVMPRLRG